MYINIFNNLSILSSHSPRSLPIIIYFLLLIRSVHSYRDLRSDGACFKLSLTLSDVLENVFPWKQLMSRSHWGHWVEGQTRFCQDPQQITITELHTPSTRNSRDNMYGDAESSWYKNRYKIKWKTSSSISSSSSPSSIIIIYVISVYIHNVIIKKI